MGDDKTIPTSLIDLRALSEPACKLIDSVKDAIGAVYKPTHIRRVAKAEADAAAIHALGEVRVQDIQERAHLRAETRALRQQENVEAVVRGAVAQLPEKVSPNPVDSDWMAEFFEQCAGKVAEPGSFSRRSLETVRLLTKADANEFTRLCRYVWVSPNEAFVVTGGGAEKFLETRGIYFATFVRLESIGLVHSPGLSRRVSGPMSLVYHDAPYELYPITAGETPTFSSVLLTSVGWERATISGAEPDPEYPPIAVRELEACRLALMSQSDP